LNSCSFFELRVPLLHGGSAAAIGFDPLRGTFEMEPVVQQIYSHIDAQRSVVGLSLIVSGALTFSLREMKQSITFLHCLGHRFLPTAKASPYLLLTQGILCRLSSDIMTMNENGGAESCFFQYH